MIKLPKKEGDKDVWGVSDREVDMCTYRGTIKAKGGVVVVVL